VRSVPHTFQTWTDDIQTIDSADGQTILGLVKKTAGVQIVRLEFDGRPLNNARVGFFDGLPEYHAWGPLAVAKNGRVFAYVSLALVPAAQPRLAIISSTGALEQLVDFASPQDNIGNMAVAADNCTIFYAHGNVIRRVNACTGTPLAAFSTLGGVVTDVAVLSNGDVLATMNGALLRLNAGGTVIHTFSIQGVNESPYLNLHAVGVSSDESTVVVAAMGYCENRGQLIALWLEDGHELWRQETSYISSATGLVVGSASEAIPMLSGSALVALAIVLAAIALVILRR
jgi:outer membrane protein assembly factor BamB